MSFREDVLAVPQLAEGYRPGLQALREADRDRVRCSDTHRLRGSVDMDRALEEAHPEEPRWDYGIGHSKSKAEEAIWVEVHDANSQHVASVRRKALWLKDWLGKHAVRLLQITRDDDGYVWLSTGGVSIQRGSRQARELALAGVSFPRKRLVLD